LVRYGSNPDAAQVFEHDGIRLYYEVYGEGSPILMIHGNGESIASMRFQIDEFRKDHRVIAMDSRDHGRSGDSPGPVTYELMADDLAALLDHLRVGPVDVVGHSDGGIEGLLLAIRHPAKIRKVVAASANTVPEGLTPEALKEIRMTVKGVTAEQLKTPEGRRKWKLYRMMLKEPHIGRKALARIPAPVLVTSADRDLIRDEHTLEIYHSLTNAQWAVFPDANHPIPWEDPERFNQTVRRFLEGKPNGPK
jgi:pimeloyl-ACP methyl ester carboxylesterase